MTTEKLNLKYNKRVKFNLELILERAVDQFYESYGPSIYRRKLDLYNAKKITVDDDTWEFETGAEYMKFGHRVPNDYIYVNSFEQGYHGGAIDGPNHPDPGTPWWKIYGEWYMPATQGPAPDDLIGDEAQQYIDEQEQQYEDEWNRIVKPYYNKFMNAMNSLI